MAPPRYDSGGDDDDDALGADLELPSLFADTHDDALLSSEELAALVHGFSADTDAGADANVDEPLATAATVALSPSASLSMNAVPIDAEQHWTPPSLRDQTPMLPAAVTSTVGKPEVKKYSRHRSNKARDARKEELAYLRRSVTELEAHLQALTASVSAKEPPGTQLRSAHAVARLPWISNVSVDSGSSRSLSLRGLRDRYDMRRARGGASERTSLWREVARRQCDERYRSERENVRLRVVLESQLKVARSLEKFLQLKAAASTTEIGKCIDMRRDSAVEVYTPGLALALSARPSASSWASADFHFAQHEHHASEAAIFEALLAGVEQSITEVDVVFEANGLARMTTTQINAQMRLDPGDADMRVEICATKALPFDVHATGAAAWNHYRFTKQRMPSRYYTYHSVKSVDETEDTIIEDFTLELHAKNTRGRFRMRQVMRRSVEADRVVIIWRSFFDPIEFSEEHLSGLRFLEKGYIVIAAASPACTLLKLCFVISPYSAAHGMGDTVGAITDFMLTSTATSVVAAHQMVENVLLEQQLETADGSSAVDEQEAEGESNAHASASFAAFDLWQS